MATAASCWPPTRPPWPSTTLAVVAAAGSLVARFSRARGSERLQLRWVALAALLVALAGVVVLVGLAVGVASGSTLFSVAVGFCLAILPVATGAAVLRYRLYDLDRIISRTLGYGLLTLLLGGGYAAVDWRFNRRRHDAAQTIAAFGTRLRDQVDLDTLTGEVLAVAEQTMQPTQASLWLRPPPGPEVR